MARIGYFGVLTLLTLAVVVASLALLGTRAWANDHEAFRIAQKLAAEGETEAAFLAYAKIPGAQYAALHLARKSPATFLAVLEAHADDVPFPLAKAVEGELRLAMGDVQASLACLRAIAACAADTDDRTWTDGCLPRESYLPDRPINRQMASLGSSLLAPFTHGPGSHRDNWLIRRFVALEAWDDARREFARVWRIHHRNARPYVIEVVVRRDEDGPVREMRLVSPAGFDGQGLLCALHYAFFLQKTGRQGDALELLIEPLLAIDMDRNPNRRMVTQADEATLAAHPLRSLQSAHSPGWRDSAGVSRKEFTRLVYGAFQDAGRAEELVAPLNREIAGGENRLRRVLARIRFHQGRTDEALALELAYVDAGGFDELSAALRRGRVQEDAGRNEQAVAAYERAWALDDQPVDLPDAEEETRADLQWLFHAPGGFGHRTPATGTRRADIAARLTRLYGALGQPVKAFTATLHQFESNPVMLGDLQSLQEAKTRADVLDAGDRFRRWLGEQLERSGLLRGREAAYWTLEDHEACAGDLAEQWKPDASLRRHGPPFEPWRDRFRKLGALKLHMFLETVLAADPGNVGARLALLELEVEEGGPRVTPLLESLMIVRSPEVHIRGRDDYRGTRFRSVFDLAYRLMRQYQRGDQSASLRALGLRMARGEAPFGPWWGTDLDRDGRGKAEDLNACLALLVQAADEATLGELETLWRDRGDFPARRQLARRRSGRFAPEEPPADVGWANLPAGVRAIVSTGTVLSLERDERYVYAGHPWGIAVYDHAGEPVTRIALGEAARAIVAADGVVWAGTPRGLMRIDRTDWTLAQLWLHGDVPPKRRHARSWREKPGKYWFDNLVYTLALDGDDLWIGTHRNVQRLNTKTMALRAYSYRELGIERWGRFDRILPDEDYVWVEGYYGVLRYDRRTDTWKPVRLGRGAAGLIGMVDGRLYGHVWLNDELRDRPCLIDRDSLEVTPLLVEGGLPRGSRCINGPFGLYGLCGGRLVFGPGYPAYVLDEDSQKLQPLDKPRDGSLGPVESILPRSLRRGKLWWPVPLRSNVLGGRATSHGTVPVRQMGGNRWTLLIPPSTRMLLGRRDSGGPRYHSPEGDWPFSGRGQDRRVREQGGLFVGRGDGFERLDAAPHGDAIPGHCVFAIAPAAGGDGTWLCTDIGVAMLDREDRVTAAFTRRDGLCGNRITSGVAAAGRMHFSCGWGDRYGGLVEADPATQVFTARFLSDGLGTSKLARLEKAGENIRLLYGVDNGRGRDYAYRLLSPGLFDPVAATVLERGEPIHYPDQSAVRRAVAALEGKPDRLCPLLGGVVITEKTIGLRHYVCGTRGMVARDGSGDRPSLARTKLTPTLTIDRHVRLRAAADEMRLRVADASELALLARDANPYVRMRALATATWRIKQEPGPYRNTLKALVADPHIPTRRLAVELLGHVGDRSAVALLENVLDDEDPMTGDAAALALARLGAQPPLERFERMFREAQGSSRRIELTAALAVQATPETFALLLNYPLRPDDPDEERRLVFESLGEQLREHPAASDVLLAAYDPRDRGPESRTGATGFAQAIFRHAGRAMLPRLHDALLSTDRIVRSNAARASGAIGDPESIEPLLRSLDLESGLSRASIVWALGEQRARAALPRLAALYVDARNDERRGLHAGFRFAQATAQLQSQFESIRRLDALARDFDELGRLAEPAPLDPRRDEPLLEPDMILAAVRKIGPAASQDFYRQLAGEDDAGVRREAARRLAEGGSADAARNLPILANLLSDEKISTRIAAAVSLLLLDQAMAEHHVLRWLGPDARERFVALRELERVEDGRRLAFARERIAVIVVKERGRDRRRAKRIQRLLDRIP